jgi:transcriptional regulator with XRE-family HTH domain
MTVADVTPAHHGPVDGSARATRGELAAFLRSRRERLTPTDVGMPPGLRRRTPGLRREEVAQLAGIGVTWYTWLEQGRPINVSVSVLDAVARTLRLDAAERAHLYRLADIPAVPEPGDDGCAALAPEVQTILDGMPALPACVYNARYDLLAWNGLYGALFPNLVSAPPERRNALWHIFAGPGCCCRFVNGETERPRMVATVRSAFARHVGDPVWTDFIDRLTGASPEFARLWAGHDVAQPGTTMKVFAHVTAGEIRLATTSLALTGSPQLRVLAYTPTDDESRDRLAWLAAHPDAPPCDHGR